MNIRYPIYEGVYRILTFCEHDGAIPVWLERTGAGWRYF